MSTPIQSTGEVVSVGEEQTFSEKFSKREVVIDEGGKYPNPIKFEFVNEEMNIIEGMNVGAEITIKGFVNGNESKKNAGQYFVSLRGKEIEYIRGEVTDDIKATAEAKVAEHLGGQASDEQSDDLPF